MHDFQALIQTNPHRKKEKSALKTWIYSPSVHGIISSEGTSNYHESEKHPIHKAVCCQVGGDIFAPQKYFSVQHRYAIIFDLRLDCLC